MIEIASNNLLQSIGNLVPIIIIIVLVVSNIICGLFTKLQVRTIITFNSLILLFAAIYTILILQRDHLEIILFHGTLLILSAISMYTTALYCDFEKKRAFEIPVLLLFAVIGMWVAIASNDFLTLYLALEIIALCYYSILGISEYSLNRSGHIKTKILIEAAVKYFILSSMITVIYLFGIMLLYSTTGEISFTNIANAIVIINEENNTLQRLFYIIGMVLVITTVFFKLSAAPFHFWAMDFYQGTHTFLTMFVAGVGKITIFAVLLRLMQQAFIMSQLQNIFLIVASISLVVGALGGIKQVNIRRLIAYSAVGNIGFILCGFAVNNSAGLVSSTLYTFIYSISVVLFFRILVLVQIKLKKEIIVFTDLSGLNTKAPLLSCLLGIVSMSMMGLPPFAGFWAKLYILESILHKELYWLLGFALLSTIISAFYYLKFIKAVYFEKENASIILLDPGYTNNSHANHTDSISICMSVFIVIYFAFTRDIYNLIQDSLSVY